MPFAARDIATIESLTSRAAFTEGGKADSVTVFDDFTFRGK